MWSIFTGATSDPQGKFGLASLTAAMLDEGAGARNALEIADAIDFLGAGLGASGSYDASAVGLDVPVARLTPALEVMSDVLRSPTFPVNELERLRGEWLTDLLQARDDAGSIAATAFPKLLFGDAHRYGTAASGTPVTIRSFTVDDLRAFHAAHYRPDNAAVIVAGDVTPASIRPLLETALGTWKAAGPKPAAATVPTARQPVRRQLYLVNKPDAAQSEIIIGGIGAARSTPDYFAITVLNTVLGGSFTSRLNQNLRETRGYAYGAGSRFDLRKWPGAFRAAAAVQTDKTAESVTEFFKELEAIRSPIPDDELGRARNYLAFGFPADFETIASLASNVEEQVLYDLPPDIFNRYVNEIQAVSAADAQRVAARYIQPDKLIVVIVGDLGKIEAPIRALKLGEINVLSIDDVMGPTVNPAP